MNDTIITMSADEDTHCPPDRYRPYRGPVCTSMADRLKEALTATSSPLWASSHAKHDCPLPLVALQYLIIAVAQGLIDSTSRSGTIFTNTTAVMNAVMNMAFSFPPPKKKKKSNRENKMMRCMLITLTAAICSDLVVGNTTEYWLAARANLIHEVYG